jgi:hypothetical protein
MDPFAVMLAEDAGKEVEKVEVMGERVDVAVAKKEVVGEELVDEVVEVALVVETWEEREVVPEEMICCFVAHMKTGRPIVSFASVSILSFFSGAFPHFWK